MNFLKRTGSRIWPLWPFVRRVLSNSNHIRGCAAVLYVRTSTTSRCYEVCYSDAAAGTYKMDAGSKAKRLRRCGRVICRNWPTISNSHHLRAKLFFDCCGMPSQTTAIETFCCLPQNEAFKCAKGKSLDNVGTDGRFETNCILLHRRRFPHWRYRKIHFWKFIVQYFSYEKHQIWTYRLHAFIPW